MGKIKQIRQQLERLEIPKEEIQELRATLTEGLEIYEKTKQIKASEKIEKVREWIELTERISGSLEDLMDAASCLINEKGDELNAEEFKDLTDSLNACAYYVSHSIESLRKLWTRWRRE